MHLHLTHVTPQRASVHSLDSILSRFATPSSLPLPSSLIRSFQRRTAESVTGPAALKSWWRRLIDGGAGQSTVTQRPVWKRSAHWHCALHVETARGELRMWGVSGVSVWHGAWATY